MKTAENGRSGRKKLDLQPLVPCRADPFIVRDGDMFYFIATVPSYDHIEIRAAHTVGELKDAPARVVWNSHESGIMSKHIWAPELHKLEGKWYIYFAAGASYDIWEIRPYVLECDGDPMTGTWRERGKMQAADGDRCSFEDFSLDMTVFEHKGAHYCIWAEKVGKKERISNLYIARMASPVKLDTVQVLLTTPDYDWEREGFWVNEGPAVLKRGNKIYITYSASATGPEYCMGMLSADADADILDPRVWSKRRYPILASDPEKGIYGPGHNSFCVDEKGRDLLVFHARTADVLLTPDPLDDPNRHTFVMPITFDDRDEPVFSFDAIDA